MSDPATHTPGPWEVYRDMNGVDCITPVGGGICVAEVRGIVREGVPESDANAALIAAAPELLKEVAAAIPLIGALLRRAGPHPEITGWQDRARAAIAKAEGRAKA